MLGQETQMLGDMAVLQQISDQLGTGIEEADIEPVPDAFAQWRYGGEVDTSTPTLPDTESWVDHIVNGSVPRGETDIAIAKKALATLAGSPYLDDAVIMGRYRNLQIKVSGNDAVFDEEHEGFMPESRLTSIDLRFRVGTACREYKDPDVFFPKEPEEGNTRGRTRNNTVLLAKSICHVCIKRQECVDSALKGSDKGGVAGALSVRQRQIVRKIKAEHGPVAAQKKVEAMWDADVKKIDDAIADELI